jgi:hypothetical protein
MTDAATLSTQPGTSAVFGTRTPGTGAQRANQAWLHALESASQRLVSSESTRASAGNRPALSAPSLPVLQPMRAAAEPNSARTPIAPTADSTAEPIASAYDWRSTASTAPRAAGANEGLATPAERAPFARLAATRMDGPTAARFARGLQALRAEPLVSPSFAQAHVSATGAVTLYLREPGLAAPELRRGLDKLVNALTPFGLRLDKIYLNGILIETTPI